MFAPGSAFFAARSDPSDFCQFAVNAGDAFDLALGGKPFVETFVAKVPNLLAPCREPLPPPLHSTFRFRIFRGEVGANTDHRLQSHWLGDHVIRIAPSLAPDFRTGFKEISHHFVIPGGSSFVGPFTLQVS